MTDKLLDRPAPLLAAFWQEFRDAPVERKRELAAQLAVLAHVAGRVVEVEQEEGVTWPV